MEKTNFQKAIEELQAILPQGQILLDEPMSKHTTFKIGGPADALIMPTTMKEAQVILETTHKYGVDTTLLGNGSNLLVMDKGIRGIVLYTGDLFAKVEIEGTKVFAQAGILLADLVKKVAESSLTGLEFAIGIPGSLGGGVYMNAGAYDGELKHHITAVTSITRDGKIIRRETPELEFGYRHSIFQNNKELIAEIELDLAQGEQKGIFSKMAELTARREAKQPLEMASAGSTFKRPPGYFAGTLIDQTGLKGLSVGGAQVSTKHAGFVVNTGNATAQDVLDLIALVQKKIYEAHGVKLYPEVRMLGEQ